MQMFYKIVAKALHKVANLLAIKSLLVVHDAPNIFFKCGYFGVEVGVLLDVTIHVKLRLKEREHQVLLFMMMCVKSLSEKQTVASESEFITLLDTRGVIVNAIQVSNEDVVNETHLDPKHTNMVLEVTVLGAGHFDKWEAIFLVSNLRRHRERQNGNTGIRFKPNTL